MLDRIHPGLDREFCGQVAVTVGRDLAPPSVCFADDGAQLGRRQLWYIDRIGLRQHAPGRADLDHVGTELHLLAHRQTTLLRPIAHTLQRARRRDSIRRERRAVAMPASGTQRVAGNQQARTFGDAGVDCIAQRDVDKVAGAYLARRGDTRLQRDLGVTRGMEGLFHRKAQHAFVETLRPVIVVVVGDMGVGVDKPR